LEERALGVRSDGRATMSRFRAARLLLYLSMPSAVCAALALVSQVAMAQTWLLTDLAIYTSNGATTVVAGGSTAYQVTVVNRGPNSADGARVTDPAVAGLSKTSVSCVVAGGGAVCPAASVALLEAPGLTIQTLPPGGLVVLSVTATVTASGGSVTN